jgi:hypothetical protein
MTKYILRLILTKEDSNGATVIKESCATFANDVGAQITYGDLEPLIEKTAAMLEDEI